MILTFLQTFICVILTVANGVGTDAPLLVGDILSKWVYFGEITSAVLIFASLLNSDQLLEERICSSGRKFIHLSVDLFHEEFRLEKANRKPLKLFPFVKMVDINSATLWR